MSVDDSEHGFELLRSSVASQSELNEELHHQEVMIERLYKEQTGMRSVQKTPFCAGFAYLFFYWIPTNHNSNNVKNGPE